MSVFFGDAPDGSWTALYNDGGLTSILPPVGPPPAGNYTNTVLSYWYRIRAFPVGRGGTVFVVRSSLLTGRDLIIKVWHDLTGLHPKLNISVGDGTGPAAIVQSTTGILNHTDTWNAVQVSTNIFSGINSGNFNSAIEVTHNLTPVELAYVSGSVIASGGILWRNTAFAVGQDIFTPNPTEMLPMKGNLSELWFTPFQFRVHQGPGDDGTTSGVVVPFGLMASAYLQVLAGNVLAAGRVGFDGNGPFPPGQPIRYPNSGVLGLPAWGIPPVYLKGGNPDSFAANHSDPNHSLMGFGPGGGPGPIPSSKFLRYGTGGVLGSGDGDPKFI
jgi:hypothetical protein